MNLFDDSETEGKREVENLFRLAMDAHVEDQYVTMEQLLVQAADTAKRFQDLPLLIKVRFWLATAQRMQSKHVQALATYTWLIGLANDPAYSSQITDENTLWYLASAFLDFLDCGRFLPEMPVERRLRVVTDGLQWIECIGKPQWIADFRLQRGFLLEEKGDLEGARQEMEVSLALARRHTNIIYSITTHMLLLAELLNDDAIEAFTEARALAEEAMSTSKLNYFSKAWAYKTLATAQLGLGEAEAALSAARASLSIAHSTDSYSLVTDVYALLGKIYRQTEQFREAGFATAQQLQWARRQGSIRFRNDALTDCAQIRLLQARETYSLPVGEKIWSDQLPTGANHSLATRRLQSAYRFIRWAQPLSVQLDRASGRRKYQDKLDQLAREADQLAVLLMKGTT